MGQTIHTQITTELFVPFLNDIGKNEYDNVDLILSKLSYLNNNGKLEWPKYPYLNDNGKVWFPLLALLALCPMSFK